jgi:hypothetical protein
MRQHYNYTPLEYLVQISFKNVSQESVAYFQPYSLSVLSLLCLLNNQLFLLISTH